METKWKLIAQNLNKFKQRGVDEASYQYIIEFQLQLLGWGDGIEVRPSYPNGSSGNLVPDFVLKKDDHNLLIIEIKKPSNILTERQKGQLASYMRRLRAPIGLYIGEKIQLFYDTPDDNEDAVPVLTVEFEGNSTAGAKLCSLLYYDNFDIDTIQDFCEEQLRMMKARNDFKMRIKEYVSPENATHNIVELLRENFKKEGYDEAIINTELKKLHITIDYNTENKTVLPPQIVKPTTTRTPVVSRAAHIKADYDSSSNEIFYITSAARGINARAIYKNGRMIILKGSIFTQNSANSFSHHDLKKDVVNKSIKLPGDVYELLEDYSFESPSAAACIVCGNSRNGWSEWKTSDGKTLKEVVKR